MTKQYLTTDSQRERVRKHYEANKLKKAEYYKLYYERNKERCKQNARDYYETNLEQVKETHRQYYNRKKIEFFLVPTTNEQD